MLSSPELSANDVHTAWLYYKLICDSVMPRIVPDQQAKFQTDDFFKKLSSDNDIRYTGYRDETHSVRERLFKEDLNKGFTDITFINFGLNLRLIFDPGLVHYREITQNGTRKNYVDFDKEIGKVCLMSRFIMNGVCVIWKGYIDLNSLEGKGRIEFDEKNAMEESDILRQQLEEYNSQFVISSEANPTDVEMVSPAESGINNLNSSFISSSISK